MIFSIAESGIMRVFPGSGSVILHGVNIRYSLSLLSDKMIPFGHRLILFCEKNKSKQKGLNFSMNSALFFLPNPKLLSDSNKMDYSNVNRAQKSCNNLLVEYM